MRSNFLTTCTNSYTRKKVASRSQLYADTKGRSMVEMLGVLAIVGVLSVGAIAGYSKAMFKYKLNKHAESFNTLLNNAIQLYPDLTRSYANNKYNSIADGARWLISLFNKMNLIPDGMYAPNNSTYIEDIFKNRIFFAYYAGHNGGTNEYLMYTYLNRDGSNKLSEYDRQICHNFVNVAKENADNLAWLGMRSNNTDGTYSSQSLYGGLAGLFINSVPTTSLLRNADVKKIDDFCSSCNSEQSCQLLIYINVTKN